VISSNPQHEAPGATPDDGQQRQTAAIGEPQDKTHRQPAFVIEIWTSAQLREQDPRRPVSLREALDAGRGPASRGEPELEPEP
jgi:hypothetical protein